MTKRRHLLVTNDFPPKVGGIQNYLWELWSRLDPSTFAVLTALSDPAAKEFDAQVAQRGIVVERLTSKLLFFPSRRVRHAIEDAADRHGADVIVLDPAFPLGILTKRLSRPCVQILHGAEVTIPGRLPGASTLLRRVLTRSVGVISAGPYPEREAARAARKGMPPSLQVPPGVDTSRFVPIDASTARSVRLRLGLPAEGPLVVSVSRLVPRKGMDTLIRAAARLRTEFPDLVVAIGGTGRDEQRLRRLISRLDAPVVMLGRVSDEELPNLVAAADVFAMGCRNRWLGLEQEGFGIVFLEAAAAGVPQVAGSSGGSADAVVEQETGLILRKPKDSAAMAEAIASLLRDPDRARLMGEAGRARAVASFDYTVLANRLGEALEGSWPLKGE